MARTAPPLHGTPPAARILIAGPSGTGKTTLARRAANLTGIPHTEIDALFHGPGWRPLPDFAARVERLSAQSAWITEWQYREHVGDLLAGRAQLLVHLDYAPHVHLTRLVLRTLRRRLRDEPLWADNREPPLRTFFTDPEHIVRWGWATRARIRRAVRTAAEAHPGLRTLVLSSPRQAEAWLRSLAGEGTQH
ncbi:AAA family ATPase [Brevibacterium sp. 5221]|uniref:AAA family ATPase n=1 Tax=Brevibacterium rongguiense TaxID=2695267 RepID=A0A6N9H693_9MICO|nr:MULTISPECIES: AAA family ATPase [Brevibacterium]MYM19580.1 AAA family ATPase [Brevibacterium rongguiense]WAL40566.1 AAA family ATPase [Brevibacterium sp. BRM-1]